MSTSKKFMIGALVLSAASLVTKMLSAVYKVPFQNLTGDQGFYVYQQLYPFYGLAVALGLSGLPQFVSKIVSESETDQEIKHNLSNLFSWLAVFSAALFLGLQIFSQQIANLMGDAELQEVVRAVSYVFLFVPFLSIARGYFQGKSNMIPTAVSQVGEQVIRVSVILLVAVLFTVMPWDVYSMGSRAMHSSWLAALASSLILLFFLVKKRDLHFVLPDRNALFSKRLGKRLLKEGLEITVMSSLMVFFQFIDSFTVYNGLMNSGYTENIARTLKGVYDRGQPFVQLGLVAGLAFSTSLLPILRKHYIAKEWNEWKLNAVSILRLTTVISSAAAVGLVAIMPWLNYGMFADFSGIAILRVFVLSVFFASLILSLQSIIQSTGLKSQTMFALFAGVFFKLTANEFIVRRLGLMGSSTVTVMSLVIVLVVMALQVPSSIWKDLFQNYFAVKWLVSLAVLFIIVNGGLTLMQSSLGEISRVTSFVLALGGAGIGGLIYLIITVKWKLLTDYETKQLPFSSLFRKLD